VLSVVFCSAFLFLCFSFSYHSILILLFFSVLRSQSRVHIFFFRRVEWRALPRLRPMVFRRRFCTQSSSHNTHERN
jgi:hypothetical protein